MFRVYIIYSIGYDKYYRDYSKNPKNRLAEHNAGESRYTRQYIPWELVYVQSYRTKTEALKREKVLKKYSKAQVKDLIKSNLNELK